MQLTFSFIKLLYFFRGFVMWGPLVRMISQIIEDVLPFFGGLAVLLVGFASGLVILLLQPRE